MRILGVRGGGLRLCGDEREATPLRYLRSELNASTIDGRSVFVDLVPRNMFPERLLVCWVELI